MPRSLRGLLVAGVLAAAGIGAWVLVRELVARRNTMELVYVPPLLTNATLELTIVRAHSGEPVKGARVFVWPSSSPLVAAAPATSDAQGRITVAGPSDVRLCVLAAPPVDAPGPSVFTEVLGLSQEYRTVDRVELPAPGASIHWVKLLTQDSGQPIEGVQVELRGYTGGQAGGPLRAAASPWENLPWIPPKGEGLLCITAPLGTYASIHVKGEGGGSAWTRVEPGHECAARAQEVRLTRGASIRAEVLGVDNSSKRLTVRPAERRSLDEKSPEPVSDVSWSATNDGAGFVVVDGLPPHVRLTAEVEVDGATRRTTTPFTLAADEEFPWTCAFGDGATIRGSIVDHLERPVIGREVWLIPVDVKDLVDLRRRTRVLTVGDQVHSIDTDDTDRLGKFELDDVQEGKYWVGPSARALKNPSTRAVCPEAQWLDVGAGGDHAVTIRIERGVFIRGRVEDASGAPVFSALVRGFGPTLQYFATRSRDDGTFKLGPLTTGDYEVTAAGPENPNDSQSANRHAPAVKIPSGTDDVVLVLATGLRLSGVVRDDATKRVERACVKLFRTDVAVEVVSQETDDTGCFEFSGLAPGAYRLTAEDIRGRSGSVPRVNMSETTSPARIEVQIGGSAR